MVDIKREAAAFRRTNTLSAFDTFLRKQEARVRALTSESACIERMMDADMDADLQTTVDYRGCRTTPLDIPVLGVGHRGPQQRHPHISGDTAEAFSGDNR